MKKLRLILGDQLNINHSWFSQNDENTTYIIIESKSETDYTVHHIQKIVAFFLAMRQFAETLISLGYHVHYIKFEDTNNKHNFTDNILDIINKSEYQFTDFEYQLPDEYRLDLELKKLAENLETYGIKTKVFDTEHFLTERNYLDIHFSKSKTYLMESFYRKIRKEHNILMINGQPIAGMWNFDSENRKKLPQKINIPKPFISKINQSNAIKSEINEIVENLKKHNVKTIGSIDPENFIWVTTRNEALEQFEYFLENQLENFGKYQDAMSNQNWTLFHSRISFALNSKLISPLEIVNRAVDFWEYNQEETNQEEISIAQIEGFVRQIIGWREFIRSIYWKFAPNYIENNFFENSSPLPTFYWSGNTKMNCMSKTIKQSLDYAYAHHIQRLMITGNFALLNLTNPKAIEQWYLGIYIDALEWVEMPNTIGMSQFADGGILATKPYISSGNYINNMSDYCKNCHYDYKIRFGEKACPFNSLYWNFIDKNKEKLAKNQRMAIPLSSWSKMNPDDKSKILNQAQIYLENVNSL